MNVVEKRIELTLKYVAEFAASHPEWADQRGAYMECCTASWAFLDWLGDSAREALGAREYTFYCTPEEQELAARENRKERDNPKPDFYLAGGVKNDVMQAHQAPWHCIVETADFYIDFTGRQYFSTCAYPLIIPKQNYLAMAAAAGVTE